LTGSDVARIYLYKLHGSLNWKMHKVHGIERTTVESFTNDPSYSDNLLVYPSLSIKTQKKIEPFFTINKLFAESLKKTDLCIIIGYSFRDEDINEIFDRHLKTGKSIIIISPTATTEFYRNLLKQEMPESIKNLQGQPFRNTIENPKVCLIETPRGCKNIEEVAEDIQTGIGELNVLHN
jgi:hypothetical protein